MNKITVMLDRLKKPSLKTIAQRASFVNNESVDYDLILHEVTKIFCYKTKTRYLHYEIVDSTLNIDNYKMQPVMYLPDFLKQSAFENLFIIYQEAYRVSNLNSAAQSKPQKIDCSNLCECDELDAKQLLDLAVLVEDDDVNIDLALDYYRYYKSNTAKGKKYSFNLLETTYKKMLRRIDYENNDLSPRKREQAQKNFAKVKNEYFAWLEGCPNEKAANQEFEKFTQCVEATLFAKLMFCENYEQYQKILDYFINLNIISQNDTRCSEIISELCKIKHGYKISLLQKFLSERSTIVPKDFVEQLAKTQSLNTYAYLLKNFDREEILDIYLKDKDMRIKGLREAACKRVLNGPCDNPKCGFLREDKLSKNTAELLKTQEIFNLPEKQFRQIKCKACKEPLYKHAYDLNLVYNRYIDKNTIFYQIYKDYLKGKS